MKQKSTTKTGRWRFAAVPVILLGAAMAFPDTAIAAGSASAPPVCSRVCWNARSASLASNMSALNRAVIHHTAGTGDYSVSSIEQSKVKVRAVQNLHMDANGWADIGYHYLVDKLGNTFEGRRDSNNKSTQRRGAHDGTNTNSFGFNVMGYYHPPYNQTFTTASRNALWDIIAWRMPDGWSPYGSGTYNGKTVGRVAGHRNVKSTSCPGDGVYALIGTNFSGGTARNAINDRIQGSGGGSSPGDQWFLRNFHSGGSANISFSYGRSTDIPIVGDWNGNGIMTPGVIRGNTWYLKNSHSGGTADIAFSYGTTGDYPITGDWNGNGVWTPGIVRGSAWHLRNSNSGGDAHVTFNYGVSSDIPVVGDWNGNGQMTNGVVRGTTWLLRNTLGPGDSQVSFSYGSPGDIPLVGDWNGNGQMTNGVLRGNRWLLRNNLGAGPAQIDFIYGSSGDHPIPGDWDGNGTMTPGVFRP